MAVRSVGGVPFEVDVNGRLRQVSVDAAEGRYRVTVDGREWTVDAARVDGHTLWLLIERRSFEVTLAPDPASGGLHVRVGETPLPVSISGRRRRGRQDHGRATGSGPQRIVAPMPGKIVRVLVKTGEAVAARQPVVVIEAMKMENELRAAAEGVVADIRVRDGESVDAGALLAVIHR